jgi:hypothetical protein
MFEINGFIRSYQFGFREEHSTIEQIRRIVQRINKALEKKQYCSAAFLDKSQAFDKVWHTRLLYISLKSYLHSRYPLVQFESEYTELPQSKLAYPRAVSWGHCYTCYTLQT